MIDRNDTFHIGRITRIRGLKGEVELRFTDDAFDRGDSPYLFLDMDGLLVPFFWEEYGFKNKETAIFSFEDIDTEDKARRLVGREVYYPLEALPDEESLPIKPLRVFAFAMTAPVLWAKSPAWTSPLPTFCFT